jgi:hypothetical protein
MPDDLTWQLAAGNGANKEKSIKDGGTSRFMAHTPHQMRSTEPY